MKILSIETSCDETAISIIKYKKNIFSQNIYINILAQELVSQINKHKEFGGVFPTLAKREHQINLPIIFNKVLHKFNSFSNKKIIWNEKLINIIFEKNKDLYKNILKEKIPQFIPEIDAIAVTVGPGLSPSLYVGVNFAKFLSTIWNIPIISVNHMEGHIFASLLIKENEIIAPEFPMLSLLVSGGHTEIILSKKEGSYEKIGQTIDDAAGEAFDKIARMIGLDYPGGSRLSELANIARQEKYKYDFVLPRPIINQKNLNFSYSGLKTAVKVLLEKQEKSDYNKCCVAKEAEDAIIETLMNRLEKAIILKKPKTILIGGGVSANTRLIEEATKLSKKYKTTFYKPKKYLATDNAIMINIAGFKNKKISTKDIHKIKTDSNLKF